MKHLRIKSGKNSKYRYLLQKIVGIKQIELKMVKH